MANLFAEFIDPDAAPRPAYTTFVEPTGNYLHGREIITWGVMDRRNPRVSIVSGLNEEQAEKVSGYLNAVTGALEE